MTRRRLFFVVGILLMLVGWYFLAQMMSWEEIQRKESQIRSFVDKHLLMSAAVGFVIYLVASLIPGTAGKAIVWGWFFGFWIALPIVCFGLTAAAVLSFLAARYLFREWAQRKASWLVCRINNQLKHEGQTMLLLSLRLLHAPYSLTNYAAGVTKIRTRTFAWTTLAGMLPGNLVCVLAGSNLPNLKRIQEAGVWTLIDWKLLIGISLLVTLPLALRWLVPRLKSMSTATAAQG